MNRFFRNDDKKINVLGDRKIPRIWWSRPFEYAFAIEFLKEGETVLDVGCGLEHPFKHYAGTICKKVVAIDTNELITELNDENVEFACADILDFEHKEKFDKIFVISTLEQSKDYLIEKFENMKNLLQDDGRIVITSDFPGLDPQKIIEYAGKAGFIVDGECDYDSTENCIYHTGYKIHCYAMVLKKEPKKEPEKPKKVTTKKSQKSKG